MHWGRMRGRMAGSVGAVGSRAPPAHTATEVGPAGPHRDFASVITAPFILKETEFWDDKSHCCGERIRFIL